MSVVASSGGLTCKAYRGDGCVLLAFNLEAGQVKGLAGFAITRTMPGKSPEPLLNRLSFESKYTRATTAKERKWFPSNTAPFQKFWWVDFPPDLVEGAYAYKITAMRFGDRGLVEAQSVELRIELGPFKSGRVEMGFTRGYFSSQAYHDQFHNAALSPDPQTIDFDTSGYQKQYEWLGFHARRMIFDFLDECVADGSATVDVFAYDLNEPDIIAKLVALGPRLRLLLDDSSLHSGASALEPEAFKRIVGKGASAIQGKFGRYAHDKVIIKKKAGKAVKVLTGSTNFSVTGMYVNANNALIFDDEEVAGFYERAFDVAFSSGAKAAPFENDGISQKEYETSSGGLPEAFLSFAPHRRPTFSLDRLLQELNKGDINSVIFAVMGLKGSGGVYERLKQIHADPKVFSYGVTDDADNGKGNAIVYSPTQPDGILVEAEALSKNIPEPFAREVSKGHRIHHKFVVVDFNDSDPVLFTGSSNLSEGGEEANGDNLIAIYDREIATAYAIEGIRLVDHYHFRAAMATATDAKPLALRGDDSWTKEYYDPSSLKYRERLLFSR